MIQTPKTKVRFRRNLKFTVNQKAFLISGRLGILSLESGLVHKKTMDQILTIFSKITKKDSRILIRMTFDCPITAKPSEVRMGKGRGSVKFWGARLRKGAVFVEALGLCSPIVKKTLKKICARLPLKTSIIDDRIF